MRNPGEEEKESGRASERKGKGNKWDGTGREAALLEFHIRSEEREGMNIAMMWNEQEKNAGGAKSH